MKADAKPQTRAKPKNKKEETKMPKVRQITFREWEAYRYKAIETILVCRHCDEWVLKLNPDRASAECTAENGHEWDEREQTMMIVRDEKGKWVLELVEVSEGGGRETRSGRG